VIYGGVARVLRADVEPDFAPADPARPLIALEHSELAAAAITRAGFVASATLFVL
jgi:hypothetical protein